jgi:hypothetical protein
MDCIPERMTCQAAKLLTMPLNRGVTLNFDTMKKATKQQVFGGFHFSFSLSNH